MFQLPDIEIRVGLRLCQITLHTEPVIECLKCFIFTQILTSQLRCGAHQICCHSFVSRQCSLIFDVTLIALIECKKKVGLAFCCPGLSITELTCLLVVTQGRGHLFDKFFVRCCRRWAAQSFKYSINCGTDRLVASLESTHVLRITCSSSTVVFDGSCEDPQLRRIDTNLEMIGSRQCGSDSLGVLLAARSPGGHLPFQFNQFGTGRRLFTRVRQRERRRRLRGDGRLWAIANLGQWFFTKLWDYPSCRSTSQHDHAPNNQRNRHDPEHHRNGNRPENPDQYRSDTEKCPETNRESAHGLLATSIGPSIVDDTLMVGPSRISAASCGVVRLKLGLKFRFGRVELRTRTFKASQMLNIKFLGISITRGNRLILGDFSFMANSCSLEIRTQRRDFFTHPVTQHRWLAAKAVGNAAKFVWCGVNRYCVRPWHRLCVQRFERRHSRHQLALQLQHIGLRFTRPIGKCWKSIYLGLQLSRSGSCRCYRTLAAINEPFNDPSHLPS
ncbi:hypothetical protein BEL07_01130 [Mycolicibacterium grossiae]|uniref:Uncharacterized protein n=1 Tax=Mycolicibacterium grossiae TaxID=1552759 RepID=A0A1E8QC63_9MYCO|nr:hypothetical protein BEL07_01130 [Mycolicibacterium grossiae]